MISENIEVSHKAFGKGTVVSISDKYFTVKFDSVEKVFVYPDIFEKFMTLADGRVPAEILSDIQISKNEKQRIEDIKKEENIRAMTKGIVIPGKENLTSDPDDDENKNKQDLEEN